MVSRTWEARIWTKDTIWRHISIFFLDHFRLTKALFCQKNSSHISIHLHTNTCLLIIPHVFIKHVQNNIRAHIHTRPYKYIHTQISSGSFTSIRITNLTTVALNLHVNDDYFGCFRLFLTNTCFHFIPITVVVYHICMSLSTMCPVFFCILANSLTLLYFIQFLSKYKDHKNDQHLITCKIYAGQSYSRDITFLNVSASCVFLLSSLKK